MTETTVSDAPAEFICPIRLQIMKDPVMSKSGQNYERQAIVEWLKRGNSSCPITRQPLKPSSLVPNFRLKAKICEWKLNNDYDDDDNKSIKDDGQKQGDDMFGTIPKSLFGLITLNSPIRASSQQQRSIRNATTPSMIYQPSLEELSSSDSENSDNGTSANADDELKYLLDIYDEILEITDSETPIRSR